MLIQARCGDSRASDETPLPPPFLFRSHPDVTKDDAEVKSALDGLAEREVSAEHLDESKEMKAQMFKAIKCTDWSRLNSI